MSNKKPLGKCQKTDGVVHKTTQDRGFQTYNLYNQDKNSKQVILSWHHIRLQVNLDDT